MTLQKGHEMLNSLRKASSNKNHSKNSNRTTNLCERYDAKPDIVLTDLHKITQIMQKITNTWGKMIKYSYF
jgi:hypothetical protein